MGRRTARAWLEARDRLSALLYERDPDGMGADVSAPRDEYNDIASRLLREALRRPEGQAVAAAVHEALPSAWPELIAELVQVIDAYERLTLGERHP